MSSLPDVLQEEWRRRIANNVEAKRASDELEFHKRKVRKMREELGVAEEWEKELQRRLNNVEKKLEPSPRKIVESFESYNQIEESILEEAVTEDHERLVAVLRKKALAMDEMDRAQLLAFVKTLLSVRDCLLEKEQDQGVEIMQKMASGVLRQLSRVSINWLEVREWEAGLLRRLIREVEGVPTFMARMVDQFLRNIVNNSSMNETVTKIQDSHDFNG